MIKWISNSIKDINKSSIIRSRKFIIRCSSNNSFSINTYCNRESKIISSINRIRTNKNSCLIKWISDTIKNINNSTIRQCSLVSRRSDYYGFSISTYCYRTSKNISRSSIRTSKNSYLIKWISITVKNINKSSIRCSRKSISTNNKRSSADYYSFSIRTCCYRTTKSIINIDSKRSSKNPNLIISRNPTNTHWWTRRLTMRRIRN